MHIGLRDNEDGTGMTAMVNWGEFAHRYHSLSHYERQAFLEDLLAKGYHHTHRLLSEASLHDEGPSLSGFTCHIPDIKTEDLLAQYEKSPKTTHLPIALLRPLLPLRHLLRTCIPSAVEFWQRQRLLEWRHLIQRHVLLHNQPLGSE